MYAHPLYSILDSGEHEKYLFLPLYGNTENSLKTACALRIDYNIHAESLQVKLDQVQLLIAEKVS